MHTNGKNIAILMDAKTNMAEPYACESLYPDRL